MRTAVVSSTVDPWSDQKRRRQNQRSPAGRYSEETSSSSSWRHQRQMVLPVSEDRRQSNILDTPLARRIRGVGRSGKCLDAVVQYSTVLGRPYDPTQGIQGAESTGERWTSSHKKQVRKCGGCKWRVGSSFDGHISGWIPLVVGRRGDPCGLV